MKRLDRETPRTGSWVTMGGIARGKCPRCLARALLALFAIHGALAQGEASLVVAPLALPGPYRVGCSNVAQDFSRVTTAESAQDYWEGIPRGDGSSRYATDLLTDPADTLAVVVNAPDDRGVYGSFAGQSIPYVVLVCYPTSPDNPRADYPL